MVHCSQFTLLLCRRQKCVNNYYYYYYYCSPPPLNSHQRMLTRKSFGIVNVHSDLLIYYIRFKYFIIIKNKHISGWFKYVRRPLRYIVGSSTMHPYNLYIYKILYIIILYAAGVAHVRVPMYPKSWIWKKN